MPFLSMLCLCSSGQRHAIPLHCRQSRASPLPRCSKLCNAFAILLEAKPFHRCSLQGSAALFLCHSTPRLCFSPPCCASPLLLFSMPRLAFPLLFSATLLSAYQFLCRSIHCDDVPLRIKSNPRCANPLQINSWLCAAFALLSCALPCHSLLCPCAAVQETSAQRKRPLPELRHWPRPR